MHPMDMNSLQAGNRSKNSVSMVDWITGGSLQWEWRVGVGVPGFERQDGVSEIGAWQSSLLLLSLSLLFQVALLWKVPHAPLEVRFANDVAPIYSVLSLVKDSNCPSILLAIPWLCCQASLLPCGHQLVRIAWHCVHFARGSAGERRGLD
jgi:hypothetical protein